MSCHRLVEGALSVFNSDHRQCYQKACHIVRNDALKWVLHPPLLLIPAPTSSSFILSTGEDR